MSAHDYGFLDNKKKFLFPNRVVSKYLAAHNSQGSVIDVGCFVGSFVESVLAYSWGNGRDVYCFDALEANVSTVAEKYGNHFVRVEHFAVGKESGTTTFTIPANSFIGDNSWGGRIVRNGMDSLLAAEIQVTVPSISLSDYLEKNSLLAPILVKIDVQGGEMDVVYGLKSYLAQVPFLYLECQLKGGVNWPWLQELEEKGFKVLLDGFQFGVQSSLTREELDSLCEAIGITIDGFHNNGLVYGISHASDKFLNYILHDTPEQRLFTYFQSDILCVNKKLPGALDALNIAINEYGKF